MQRSKRLQPVLDLAMAKEQMAAQRLGQAQVRVDAARRSLDNLRRLMDDYAIRFERAGEVGLGAPQLADYRSFLARINAAIEDQERTLTQAERNHLSQRLAWEQARTRASGMQKVVESAQDSEVHAQRRLEQAAQDERAARGVSLGNRFE